MFGSSCGADFLGWSTKWGWAWRDLSWLRRDWNSAVPTPSSATVLSPLQLTSSLIGEPSRETPPTAHRPPTRQLQEGGDEWNMGSPHLVTPIMTGSSDKSFYCNRFFTSLPFWSLSGSTWTLSETSNDCYLWFYFCLPHDFCLSYACWEVC